MRTGGPSYSRLRGVIPDGIEDALANGIGHSELYPNTSWYEVKVTSGVISASSFGYQPAGLVDALYKYDPEGANMGLSSVTFVTTSDAGISQSLIVFAKANYNINIWQFRALYRETPTGVKISFYDTDLTFPIFFRYDSKRSSTILKQ